MSDFSPNRAAEMLMTASQTRTPIEPITEDFPNLTVEQAYSVQQVLVDAWKYQGGLVRGYKVGLTSAAMQRQLGVDQPDFGHLMSDMFYANAARIPAHRFITPKVEPEFAFVLGRELRGPHVTTADAARAIDGVCGALEIIDSRIKEWRITLADTVADNASSGGVVLGDVFKRLDAVNLRTEGVELKKDGATVGTGAGAAVLGSPLAALVWLANTLGTLGVTLEAGSVILPGSMTGAVPVETNSTITANFAHFGPVTAHFSVHS